MFVRWEQRGESFRASLEERVRVRGEVVAISASVGSPPVYLTQEIAKKIAESFARRDPRWEHDIDYFRERVEAAQLLVEADRPARVRVPHIDDVYFLTGLGEPVLQYYYKVGKNLPILADDEVHTLRTCEAIWAQITQIYYRVLARFFVGVFLGVVDDRVDALEIVDAAYIFPVTVFTALNDHIDWLHQSANSNNPLPHGLDFVRILFIAGLKEFHQVLQQHNNLEDFINTVASHGGDLDAILGGRGGGRGMDELRENAAFLESLRQYAHRNVEQILQVLMLDYGSAVGERNYTRQAVSAWTEWQSSNCKGWC